VITRDARGALVHVRTAQGECIGCIEVGLYEIVRMLIANEEAAVSIQEEGVPNRASAATTFTLARGRRDEQPHC
jgi:hypothetical protein